MTSLTLDCPARVAAGSQVFAADSQGADPAVETEPRALLERPKDLVAQQVQLALAGAQAERHVERRTETRHPYPYPIHMTPLDREGRPLLGDTFVVVGKHLSNHGADFYFAQPLEWSRVVASFPLRDGKWVGIEMELTWCRFSRHGWYDNGGRFLGVTESPLGG
jgi:hypothetical protein